MGAYLGGYKSVDSYSRKNRSGQSEPEIYQFSIECQKHSVVVWGWFWNLLYFLNQSQWKVTPSMTWLLAFLVPQAQYTFSFVLICNCSNFVLYFTKINRNILKALIVTSSLPRSINNSLSCLPYRFLWSQLAKLGSGLTKNTPIDIFLNCYYLSAWYCIDIVRRNSVTANLIFSEAPRVHWLWLVFINKLVAPC